MYISICTTLHYITVISIIFVCTWRCALPATTVGSSSIACSYRFLECSDRLQYAGYAVAYLSRE